MGHAYGHDKHILHLFEVVTPPEPFVTLAEVKEWLEIDHTDRDTMLTAMLKAACRALDGYDGLIGKAIMEQTIKISLDCLSSRDRLALPVFPATSIHEIAYYVDGVKQTATLSDFGLYSNEDWAYIEPLSGNVWPSADDERPDAYEVTYIAKMGDIDEIAEDLKTAAKQLTAAYFENREGVTDLSLIPVPYGMETIIGKYRVGWIK